MTSIRFDPCREEVEPIGPVRRWEALGVLGLVLSLVVLGQPTLARASTGTVSGKIQWTDAQGHIHPVRGALVQFYDGNGNFLGTSTNTE